MIYFLISLVTDQSQVSVGKTLQRSLWLSHTPGITLSPVLGTSASPGLGGWSRSRSRCWRCTTNWSSGSSPVPGISRPVLALEGLGRLGGDGCHRHGIRGPLQGGKKDKDTCFTNAECYRLTVTTKLISTPLWLKKFIVLHSRLFVLTVTIHTQNWKCNHHRGMQITSVASLGSRMLSKALNESLCSNV